MDVYKKPYMEIYHGIYDVFCEYFYTKNCFYVMYNELYKILNHKLVQIQIQLVK